MEYFGFLGNNQEQVLNRVNPILDNILEAHEKKKYDLFIRNLQQEMREKISEKQFHLAAKETHKRLGQYQNRQFLAGLRRDDRPMLVWKAKFSRSENDILMTLVLDQQDSEVVVNWFWVE